ncbi:MAG: hypothetical protein U9Q99_03365 [Nanoarchaeota archaeon]|nr:hypothetical protein [Nanoarchaeota archaeon]
MKNNRGEILIENVIFIILNLVFLTILSLFLIQQGSVGSLLEDAYSKQIALIADSAQPGMKIKINMQDAFKITEKENYDFSKVISKSDNFVKVQLSEKGGKEYPFFNDIEFSAYPDGENGIYILIFSKK